MRWKLAESLSTRELGIPYIAGQLRVLNGRMQQEGSERGSAARVYLFLRDFPQLDAVDLYAVGVIDPDLESDLTHHINLLPAVVQSSKTFRTILLPGLGTVHERCP
jgi:hypothetical protein